MTTLFFLAPWRWSFAEALENGEREGDREKTTLLCVALFSLFNPMPLSYDASSISLYFMVISHSNQSFMHVLMLSLPLVA